MLSELAPGEAPACRCISDTPRRVFVILSIYVSGALSEIVRVIAPGGALLMMWNMEDGGEAWVRQYRDVYEYLDASVGLTGGLGACYCDGCCLLVNSVDSVHRNCMRLGLKHDGSFAMAGEAGCEAVKWGSLTDCAPWPASRASPAPVQTQTQPPHDLWATPDSDPDLNVISRRRSPSTEGPTGGLCSAPPLPTPSSHPCPTSKPPHLLPLSPLQPHPVLPYRRLRLIAVQVVVRSAVQLGLTSWGSGMQQCWQGASHRQSMKLERSWGTFWGRGFSWVPPTWCVCHCACMA